MSQPLTPVAEGLWVSASPLTMLGLHLGTRMTVARLPSGGLWVHSPVELDDALRGAIDELGPVEHIVAPNLYHHLFAGGMAEAYPDATLWGVPGLAKKRKDLSFGAEVGPGCNERWGGDLEPHVLAGTMLGETAFVHRASGTLVTADGIENFKRCDHGPTRLYLKISDIWQKPGFSRLLRPLVRDRAALRASIRGLLALELDRIILSHGDVIESGGRDALADSYRWLGV